MKIFILHQHEPSSTENSHHISSQTRTALNFFVARHTPFVSKSSNKGPSRTKTSQNTFNFSIYANTSHWKQKSYQRHHELKQINLY